MKVLILSCGTGEGHNSAAYALKSRFSERNIECEVADVLRFKSEKSKNKICDFYNNFINKTPLLFGVAYTLGGVYDALKLPSPVYSYNAKYAGKLLIYISENKFTTVICTHLFAMLAMTAIKRGCFLPVKVYGVFTDYTSVPFYKDTDLDGYFVSCTAAGRTLIAKGIPRKKIFYTGIPVRAEFNGGITKVQAKEYLKIPENKRVVCVLNGGTGCGK